MADEIQAEIYGGNWWNSPFTGSSFTGNYFMNMKTISTDESSGGCATAISPDSACQITVSSPSTTSSWYQALSANGRTGENHNGTLPEILNDLMTDGGRNSSNSGMEQEQTSNFMTTSGDCIDTSTLLQTLFDGVSSSPPPVTAASPVYDYQVNLNDFDPVSSMSLFSSNHVTNKTVFWNTSGLDINEGFLLSKQSQCPNIKSPNEEIWDMGSSVKKIISESTPKRPRLETPSPLPTFKVRKEKLGDRVTALQQLVSPFGKTDTASVLHEAIEYIKLLHDQVKVLSNPYMKYGATMQVQQICNKVEDNNEGAKQQDLRSRGLCLVPISTTFPVAIETAPDYWTTGFTKTFK